jgi:hypothetical protein
MIPETDGGDETDSMVRRILFASLRGIGASVGLSEISRIRRVGQGWSRDRG